MTKRYQVTFGQTEAIKIEATAKDRGISPSTLIRESSLLGLMNNNFDGIKDRLLIVDLSKIIINTDNPKRKIWKVFDIPDGFNNGYITSPKVEFNIKSQETNWNIKKSTFMGEPFEKLWDENDSLILFRVFPGDKIYISLPKSIDPKKDIKSITMKYVFKD